MTTDASPPPAPRASRPDVMERNQFFKCSLCGTHRPAKALSAYTSPGAEPLFACNDGWCAQRARERAEVP